MLDLTKLSELIALEKERLSSPLHYKDEELALLSSLWDNDESDLIKVIYQADSTIVVQVLLLAFYGSTLSLEEIKRIAEKNKQIPEMELEYTLRMVKELSKIKNLKMLERVKSLTRKDTYSEEEIETVEYSIKTSIEEILKDAQCTEYDLESLFQLAIDQPNYYKIVLPIIQLTRRMYSESPKSMFKQKSSFESRLLTSTTRTKHISMNGSTGMVCDRAMQNALIRAKTYYEKLKNEKVSKEKTRKKELASLENLEVKLPELLASEEITTAKELLNRITSQDIRLETLKLIYLHNKSIYDRLKKEYQKLSASKVNKYQSLLNKYGISIDTSVIANIMINPLADVEKMLAVLTKIGIVDPTQILSVLEKSNLEAINSIIIQVTKGIISNELLKNNISIFYCDSKKHRNFLENISFFQEKALNPHYMRSHPELLLVSPETIKNNVKILEDYNLVGSMRTGMDCSFLVSSNLEDSIDTLLELGYERLLEQNLSLLSYQSNFKRLRVLKELNIPITSMEELESILTTEKFLIPDENIDEYLYNAVPYILLPVQSSNCKRQLLETLESFSKTERTYAIGEAIISKNKVKRNLDKLETTPDETEIICGIIKGSFLSEEEIENIIKTITEKNTKPVKIKA